MMLRSLLVIFFGDVIVEKLKVTKNVQHVGYQHVLISYTMQYEQRHRGYSLFITFLAVKYGDLSYL